MRKRPQGWLLVLLALAGCKRDVKYLVDRVEVAGATVMSNAVLGLPPDEVQAMLQAKLAAQGRFVLPGPDLRSPPDGEPLRLTLELDFTREAAREEGAGTFLQAGVTLILRRRGEEGAVYYDVQGLGEAAIQGSGMPARRTAARDALAAALQDAVAAAHLHLLAADKKDAALVKDLSSGDTRVREYAVRVLAERKNPAVTSALLERLSASEPEVVRRAIGGLVELRETRAVPALIDLTHGKDPSFVREILFAVGSIGGDEAEAYLYTVAAGHDLPAIQEAAQQALEELQARARAQRGPGSTTDNAGQGKDAR